MEPQIQTEAPLDLQRYFLQIEFLQKNYNFHFAESLKALSSPSLQQQQDGNGVDRQKTFQNFEASHNDLVAQMTKLLGSMKSQFEEKSAQVLAADMMPQEEEEAVPSSREPSFSTRNGQQNPVVVDDMLNLGVENDDDEDLEEEDDDDIDDIASLMMTDDSFVGSEE